MKHLIIACIAWAGMAAADPLAAPGSIPAPDDVKDACVLARSSRAAGYTSGIEVGSGKDGQIVRRGLWKLADGKLKRADILIENAWTGGRLTRSRVVGGDATTYAYDARGLVTRLAASDRSVTYTWRVKPVTTARLILPHRMVLANRDLPSWLPFQGKVDVTLGGGAPHTFTYDRHGILKDPRCTFGARGLPTTCRGEGGDVVHYTWKGRMLVGLTDVPNAMDGGHTLRMHFAYGRDGRITDLRTEQSLDGKTWKPVEHTTVEYRCQDTFFEDADAVWPR